MNFSTTLTATQMAFFGALCDGDGLSKYQERLFFI